MKKRIILIPLALLFAGCFASKTLTTPAQADVDRVQTKYPGYTLADLNHGKSLYTEHCGTCHGLKNPSDFTEEQWNKIVPNMVAKVNKHGNILDQKAEQDILRYTVTMSRR